MILAKIALVAFILCCLISLYYYINGKSKFEKETPFTENNHPAPTQIVGVSKTKVGQKEAGTTVTSTPKEANKRLVVPNDEIDKVFYTEKEAQLDIDVDIEHEYQQAIDEEDEFLQLEETEIPQADLARGASFDELAEMSQAIQADGNNLGNEKIIQTGQTIEKVKTTDMFEQLVNQVKDGELKVADILDRCEAAMKKTTEKNSVNEDLEGFDLDRFM